MKIHPVVFICVYDLVLTPFILSLSLFLYGTSMRLIFGDIPGDGWVRNPLQLLALSITFFVISGYLISVALRHIFLRKVYNAAKRIALRLAIFFTHGIVFLLLASTSFPLWGDLVLIGFATAGTVLTEILLMTFDRRTKSSPTR